MYSDALDAIPDTARKGRLTARPSPSPRRLDEALAPGVHRLPGDRSATLIVPSGYLADAPAALVVVFHGAGGDAQQGLDQMQQLAEESGAILFVPESQGPTWDGIHGLFGPDVARLDLALKWLFERCTVDPSQIAMTGFSDGASYALTLGLTNGDLFSRVVAFSPGFAHPLEINGRPRIFISHGRADAVLGIDRTSRTIVTRLRSVGYTIDYVEDDAGHAVTPEALAAAIAWLRS